MTQQTNLNRTVFDKEKFNQTVDTQFSQLIDRDQPIPFEINTATLADFFAYIIDFSMKYLNREI